jgi:hypothetical protein
MYNMVNHVLFNMQLNMHNLDNMQTAFQYAKYGGNMHKNIHIKYVISREFDIC